VSRMERHTPLLVIGAGPFGLATAAYARRCGIEPLVVGHAMAFWKAHMPAGMFLRSGVDWHLDAASDWTIERFLAERDISPDAVKPFPMEVYLDYVDWFQQQAGLDPLPAAVVQLDRGASGGYVAQLDDGGVVSAARVVVAIGFRYFVSVPPEVGERLPAGRFAHTCDAVDLARYAGRRCLIVGGRQSAFEWAALLGEHGAASVDVAYRHDTPQFAESHWDWTVPLITRFVDEPGWYRRLTKAERDALTYRFWFEGRAKLEPWLEPRLRAGRVTLRPRTVIHSTAADAAAVRVEFESGEAVTVDDIIMATGYKPALARVPFIARGNVGDHVATQNGCPILDDAMQSTSPGLYFTSMLATEMFGPFFAFTGAARAAARLIGDSAAG
jgi:cation diffusion facilitator CzcD-associated flavoprotein CzcO